ncbi:ATP-binding protein [Microbacterium sp. ProA8]|uniref:ATP-binding protein n=1 Tax=Microbacterium chionoecetis TaxID=3153754 RepID=UPI00326697A4
MDTEAAEEVSTVVPLLGRSHDAQLIRGLITAARNGTSGALILRGDPGIGKTTLLRSATQSISGATVLRVTGFHAESALPYAGLQRLGMPLQSLLGEIPRRQREALEVHPVSPTVRHRTATSWVSECSRCSQPPA